MAKKTQDLIIVVSVLVDRLLIGLVEVDEGDGLDGGGVDPATAAVRRERRRPARHEVKLAPNRRLVLDLQLQLLLLPTVSQVWHAAAAEAVLATPLLEVAPNNLEAHLMTETPFKRGSPAWTSTIKTLQIRNNGSI